MCHKLYKGLHKHRWMKKCIWSIDFSVVPTDDERELVIAFHGAWPDLLKRVFDRLQGALFSSYSVVCQYMADMVNGKCTNSLVVTIANPDLHCAGVNDFCTLIEYLLQKTIPCQVTRCKTYEAFVNS